LSPTKHNKRIASAANAEPAANTDARDRLLAAALEVFAAKGFGQASTREICKRADVNVAGIHYYFGDKASLYRELFLIPERMTELPPALDQAETTLRDGLDAWYRHVMGFVLGPDKGNQLRLLFLREQVEPSGLLEGDRVGIIGLYHPQLVRFLAQRLHIPEPDPALHQLAFSLIGMAMVFFVERAAVQQLAPGLLNSAAALDETISRLVVQAEAAVASESTRRKEQTQ
jgi:TetR/AcrR family transcriptional regulator, regulator of cefoperazone and chloramphenicol sensitivity